MWITNFSRQVWTLGVAGAVAVVAMATAGPRGTTFESCTSYVPGGEPACTRIDIPAGAEAQAVQKHAAVDLKKTELATALVAAIESPVQGGATPGRSPASFMGKIPARIPGPILNARLRSQVRAAGGARGAESFLMPQSSELGKIPQDPRNPLTPDKIRLGALLFHETGTGLNPVQAANKGTYSCASCHHVDAGFSAGVVQGLGEGGVGFGVRGTARRKSPATTNADIDVQPISSPTALNIGWQECVLWNGQFGATGDNAGTEYAWTAGTPKAVNHLGFQGTEIQAIAGNVVHRLVDQTKLATLDASVLKNSPFYAEFFAKAFPELPESERVTQVNVGLAIAAYERTLISNRAPFQAWLRGNDSAMSDAQKRGALLFFGKASCVQCHNGPALAAMEFHALGFNDLDTAPGAIIKNPAFSEKLGRGAFTGRDSDMYRFKVPTLYNLKEHAAFGHGSSFRSVREVVEYHSRGIPQNPRVPSQYLSPHFTALNLTPAQVTDLTEFLENGLYDADLRRYLPRRLPSGQCFPNNDLASKADPYSYCDRSGNRLGGGGRRGF